MSSSQEVKSPVQFESSEIGVKTAKREDPFAEQNRVRAEKKQARRRQVRKYSWLLALAVLLVVGGIVLLILWWSGAFGSDVITEDDYNLTEDIRDEAETIYGGSGSADDNGTNDDVWSSFGNIEEVEAYLSEQEAQAKTEAERVAAVIAAVVTYADLGYYDKAAEASEKLNPEELSYEVLLSYISVVLSVYTELGDFETVDYYMELFASKGGSFAEEEDLETVNVEEFQIPNETEEVIE